MKPELVAINPSHKYGINFVAEDFRGSYITCNNSFKSSKLRPFDLILPNFAEPPITSKSKYIFDGVSVILTFEPVTLSISHFHLFLLMIICDCISLKYLHSLMRYKGEWMEAYQGWTSINSMPGAPATPL